MAIVVQDIHPGMQRRDSDGQIGQRQAVGSVGSSVGKLAHCGQDAPLDGKVDGDLPQSLQGLVDGRDPLGTAGIDGQLEAHRPAPGHLAPSDRLEEQLASIDVAASNHPS